MIRYPLVKGDVRVAAIGALVIFAAGFVYINGTAYDWRGVWTQTGQFTKNSVLLSGPIVVALSCWLGGAEHRNGFKTLALTSPRSPLRRQLATIVLSQLSSLIPFAVLSVVTAWQTGRHSAFQVNSLFFFAIGLAAFSSLSLIGCAVGTRYTATLLPLVLVLVTYVLLAYLSSFGTVTNLQPLDDRDVTYSTVSADFAFASIVWFVAIGLAVIFWSWRATTIVFVPAIVAVVCAIYLTSQPRFPYHDNDAAASLSCTRSPTIVCLSRAHRYLGSEVQRAAGDSRAPLAGTSLAPAQYVESVAGQTGRDGNTIGFNTTNGRLYGSAIVAYDAQLEEFASLTFSAYNCLSQSPSASAAYQVTASDVVEAWYRRKLGLPDRTVVDPANAAAGAEFRQHLSRFEALGTDTRKMWIGAHAGLLLTCKVPVAGLP